jgi:hypothetical protein
MAGSNGLAKPPLRMEVGGTVDKTIGSALKSFLIELAVYAALVTVYFFLVLHFLGNWLYHVFQQDRRLYATLALVFIITQGVVLEALTRWLLAWFKPRRRSR